MICCSEKKPPFSPSSLNSIEGSRLSRLIHSSHKACLISALALSVILVATLIAQLAGVLSLIASIVLFSILALSFIVFIASLVAHVACVQKFIKLAATDGSQADVQIDDSTGMRGHPSTYITSHQTLPIEDGVNLVTQEEFLECILNCEDLYRNLKLRVADSKITQSLMQDAFALCMKTYELKAKSDNGLPLATSKELGLMFFPKFINPLKHPILGVVYRLHSLLTTPDAGAVWLSETLKNPSNTRESCAHLLIDENVTLWNMFLTGWCLSSDASRGLVLSRVRELHLDTENTNQVLADLDSGNVLAAVIHSCMARGISPLFASSHRALNARSELGWGLTQCRGSAPHVDGLADCLVKLEDYCKQLQEALPSTLLSLQFFQEDTPVSDLISKLLDFFASNEAVFTHPYATTSALITVIIFCVQNPRLLIKVKKLSPNKVAATMVHLLSTLLKGALVAGVLTNKHLDQFSQASGLHPQIVLDKIHDSSLLPTLLSKML